MTAMSIQRLLSSYCLQKMNAYWGVANYLSASPIYLYDTPLLKTPLTLQAQSECPHGLSDKPASGPSPMSTVHVE